MASWLSHPPYLKNPVKSDFDATDRNETTYTLPIGFICFAILKKSPENRGFLILELEEI